VAKRKNANAEITAFVRKARPLLLAAGANIHAQWEQRIGELELDGQSRPAAIITASKEFACLTPLFVDPDTAKPEVLEDQRMASEDREQSHIENLRWAADAAGRALRTGRNPATCPNDTAYGFFVQAMADYKGFMATLSQSEGRSKQEAEKDDEATHAERLSIEEIEKLLERI
jgi:hypothetical protein